MKKKRLLLSVVLSVGLVGCGVGPYSDRPESQGRVEAGLKGSTVTNITSTADDLTTPDGIVGTVGALFVWNEYEESSFNCTGTLVTRNTFLTAAHCVIDREARTIYNRDMSVKFPQMGWAFRVDSAGIQVPPGSVQRAIEDMPHGFDLAVVPLLDPVPSSVVANVAPIFTGDIHEALYRRSDRLTDAIQVGMGENNQEHEGLQFRAWGNLRTLRFGSFLTGPALLADDMDETFTALGDSGGPVFMLHRGVYTLVGVSSGFYDALEIKAYTGSGPGGDNASWLVPLLGEDADGDGIIDDADNCPPQRCIAAGRDAADCANPTQEDDDGDGVGDACDNCPGWVCKVLSDRNPQLAALYHCDNPDQANRDGDDLGDSCDLCPTIPNGASLDDRDNDLVGDDCDPCLGESPYQQCWVGSSDCEVGDCLGHQGYGHCSLQLDSDGDTIPDACDNCPGVRTRILTNANSMAERQFEKAGQGVEPLGDWCESVPLFRMDVPQPELLLGPPEQEIGINNPATVIELVGDSWIGCDPNAGCDPGRKPGCNSKEGGVAFRFCSCLRNGKELLSPNECNDNCDASLWNSLGGFVDITVKSAAGSSVSVQDPAAQGFFDRRGVSEHFSWWFFEDVQLNKLQSYDVGGLAHVHGFVGSHAFGSGVSGRDTDSDQQLRTSVVMVTAPNYKLVDTWVQPSIAICSLPNCIPWLRDQAMERINPNPMADYFEMIGNNAILTSDLEKVALHLPGRDAFDVTNLVDVEVAKLLGDPGAFAYYSGVEHASLLAAAGISPKLVVVPREGSGLTSPARLALRESRLVVVDRTAEVQDDLSVSSRLASVVVPATGRAVYSELKGKLYVAGGALLGAPIGNVRVYDFATDGWAPLVVDLDVGEHVLGLALDVLQDRLYMLDVNLSGDARLSGIDLKTNEARVYLEVPYKQLFEHYGLAVDADGALVLVASRESLMNAWRFGFEEEKEKLTCQGKLEIVGSRVLDQAVFKRDNLVLPVSAGASFDFRDLGQHVFEECAGVITELKEL